MSEKTIIYGRGNCPHTKRAVAALGDEAEFRDFLLNPEWRAEMDRLSDAGRIPVLVAPDGVVTVGYRGGS